MMMLKDLSLYHLLTLVVFIISITHYHHVNTEEGENATTTVGGSVVYVTAFSLSTTTNEASSTTKSSFFTCSRRSSQQPQRRRQRGYHSMSRSIFSTNQHMIGGRGWDNSDYLSSLSPNGDGGDDNDNDDTTDENEKRHMQRYQEYSERRAAFMERQQEIMKSPQGQRFLQQLQDQEYQRLKEDERDEFEQEDVVGEAEPTLEGGTRMSRMMAQARRMKQQQQQFGGMGLGVVGGGPFEQKLAVGLDYDDTMEEDDDCKNISNNDDDQTKQ